jgi:hypothetical protein
MLLSVEYKPIMLSVILLNVMAPWKQLESDAVLVYLNVLEWSFLNLPHTDPRAQPPLHLLKTSMF